MRKHIIHILDTYIIHLLYTYYTHIVACMQLHMAYPVEGSKNICVFQDVEASQTIAAQDLERLMTKRTMPYASTE